MLLTLAVSVLCLHRRPVALHFIIPRQTVLIYHVNLHPVIALDEVRNACIARTWHHSIIIGAVRNYGCANRMPVPLVGCSGLAYICWTKGQDRTQWSIATFAEVSRSEVVLTTHFCLCPVQPGDNESEASESDVFLTTAMEEAESSKADEGVPFSSEKFESALTDAFNRTDEEFGKADNAALVGTTAVVALVGSRQLYVANCGECSAVCYTLAFCTSIEC